MAPWVSSCLRAAISVLAPAACVGCDAPLPGRGTFCTACGSAGAPLAETLAGGVPLVALGRYEGALARAVQRLKYEGRPDLAGPLAAALAEVALGERVAPSLLVPVPLHPRRLSERGYNQSALLGRALAPRLGARCSPLALLRSRVTEAQATLGRAERLANVADAFAARAPLAGETVALIDDVVTTGSTALACQHALDRAGARVCAVLALARASHLP